MNKTSSQKIIFSYNNKNLAIQQSGLVALAGQTRGAVRVVLELSEAAS